MSFTRVALYAASPTTTRGQSTKLSASKEKIVYTNGKTVYVSCADLFIVSQAKSNPFSLRYAISPSVPFHTRTHTLKALTNPARETKNPALGVSYSGHVQNTTVARISPTGYYCASADTLGTGARPLFLFIAESFSFISGPRLIGPVRVWDIVGEDQSLKGEY